MGDTSMGRWHGAMTEDKAVALREPLPWQDLRDLAATAEETGYRAVMVPEVAGREAFATLAALAGSTSSIHLGTGVIPITARTAPVAAMAAATVQDLSDGRLILGVGAGRVRPAVERTRRYVDALRRFLAGEELLLRGAADRFRLTLAVREPVPIWLAALGPRMTELAGEVADGVLLNWCTPDRVADAVKEVSRGAEAVGRDPGTITVAVYVRACLGMEEHRAHAALGPAAAEYAALPHYRRQFESMGLGREAEIASRALRAGEPNGVPEALVRALSVSGSRQEALVRLRAYHEAGADTVVVYPVPTRDPLSSMMSTILAAAPSPAVER